MEHEKYLDLEKGRPLPGLHKAAFHPDFYPAFRGGVAAMTKTMIDLSEE